MKRLAFLGFAIATLMAPIQVQAQQCVTFRGRKPNCGIYSLIRVLSSVYHRARHRTTLRESFSANGRSCAIGVATTTAEALPLAQAERA
jgi:hypothetical protein